MNNKYFLFVLFFLTGLVKVFSQEQTYFASFPALSPDGKQVIFSYEGDLWKVAATGGVALRLTAMPGEETLAKVSPDGKWLAFTGNQFGNNDVFIMPLEGGAIKQLTFHEASDELDNWSWDSKSIYFTSSRYNSSSSYRVGINGGTATRLFEHYFNTTHHIAVSPNGELFFNDTWESRNAANRKRYKGAYNPDIQSYNPLTKSYKQYTDYTGKDFWTSIDQNGNVYFVSDEANGEYNLYTFLNGKKTALTKFETSIKRPFVAANGNTVVFEKDYQLWVYDVAQKASRKISIATSRNHVLVKDQEFDVKANISNFEASPDGKKIAFISRGSVFVSDVDGKFIRKISANAERALEVKWLADSKTLLFNQTQHGYQNWFVVAADGVSLAKQITNDKANNRDISFNKAKTFGVYLSGRNELRLLDLKTFNSKLLLKDEFWAVQNSAPSFSPNDQYIVFTAFRNFEQDIFVYELASAKVLNLTNTGVTESNPIWSPDGKYIYFTSDRTNPSYPMGMTNAHVYRMALDLVDQPFRSVKFDALFKEDKQPANTSPEKKKDSVKKVEIKLPKSIVINLNRIDERIELVSPSFGTQYLSAVFAKGDKTYVVYSSTHEGARPATYRSIIEDFEANKTEKIVDGGLDISEAGNKYFALGAGQIQKYNIDANKLDKIDLSFKFSRNLDAEFKQMFDETWVGLDENFYDENFHGLDWAKTRERYALYLPYVNNRSDLRILLNDMLGELNASHLGFTSSGIEERKLYSATTNETGLLFSASNPYQVEKIVDKSPASFLGEQIKKGDLLVAVNGDRVNSSLDRDYYFTKPSLDREMNLTFTRAGKEFSVDIHPQTSASFKSNLYDEWIYENRERVNQLSKDKIAYSHMKNMSAGELEHFLLDMVAQENSKQGIILDLRYNTGGNVHDAVLKFLAQRPYLQWKYRGGKMAPQSNFGPAAKPIVLLINEQSLSDAEMTAAGFKQLKLGKIIGNETYRWIIFTSAKGLVDGSSYRLPSWGCYTMDGQDLEKEGVKPDIFVKNTFTNRLEGQDPQLERAIAEILKDIK